jgi:hypothetical protein
MPFSLPPFILSWFISIRKMKMKLFLFVFIKFLKYLHSQPAFKRWQAYNFILLDQHIYFCKHRGCIHVKTKWEIRANKEAPIHPGSWRWRKVVRNIY